MKTELLDSTPTSLKKVVELLSQNEVVALPTETVYGLAGNAFSKVAVKKIFEAKDRPHFDPLITHVGLSLLSETNSPLESLVSAKIISKEVLGWSSRERLDQAMKNFWPGALTFVLPRGELIPDEVTSGQNTVGIRCPAHPLFQTILDKLSFPLAAPSANRFGRISPTHAKHVCDELNGSIAAILDGGPCEVGVESTIIKVEDPLQVTLLRPGQVSAESLSQHFGVEIKIAQTLGEKNQIQQAPGMLDSHYAPKKPLLLVPHSFSEIERTVLFLGQQKIKKTIGFLASSALPDAILSAFPGKKTTLSLNESLEEMAKNLFASLRNLDEDPSIEIIIADVPKKLDTGLGRAVQDRLNRASFNKPF